VSLAAATLLSLFYTSNTSGQAFGLATDEVIDSFGQNLRQLGWYLSDN